MGKPKFAGNKGEWSEIYVLLKLASDGRLQCTVDGKEGAYTIVKLFRQETEGLRSYSILPEHVQVEIDGKPHAKIPRDEIEKNASLLLKEIKSLKDNKLENPRISEFLGRFGCRSLKAKSTSKSDLHIIIHDHRTGLQPRLGFSIKSKVGSDSTILNAGNTTLFSYRLTKQPTPDLIRTLGSKFTPGPGGKKAFEVRQIMDIFQANDIGLSFDTMKHPVAAGNFIKIDSRLPDIFADFLVQWYRDERKRIPWLCENIDLRNPFKFPVKQVPRIYHYKVKKFLAEVSLGMVPGTPWDGKYDATGGFITIEENGEISCFHLIDRNELENYLFENTYLDTPSSARYGSFGGIYKDKEEGGEGDGGNVQWKIDLCLQIRFRDRLKL